jgi:hypothetical protein
MVADAHHADQPVRQTFDPFAWARRQSNARTGVDHDMDIGQRIPPDQNFRSMNEQRHRIAWPIVDPVERLRGRMPPARLKHIRPCKAMRS